MGTMSKQVTENLPKALNTAEHAQPRKKAPTLTCVQANGNTPQETVRVHRVIPDCGTTHGSVGKCPEKRLNVRIS